MTTPLTPLQTELIQEELSQLFYISSRHLRWANATDDLDIAKVHRHIANEVNSLCNEVNRRFFGAYEPRYRRADE